MAKKPVKRATGVMEMWCAPYTDKTVLLCAGKPITDGSANIWGGLCYDNADEDDSRSLYIKAGVLRTKFGISCAPGTKPFKVALSITQITKGSK